MTNETSGRMRAIGGTLWAALFSGVLLSDVWRAGSLVLDGAHGSPSSDSVSLKAVLVIAASFVAWTIGVSRLRMVTREADLEKLARVAAVGASAFMLFHAGLVWRVALGAGSVASLDALATFAATAWGVGVYVGGIATTSVFLSLALRDQLPARLRLGADALAIAVFAGCVHALGALTVGRRLFEGS